MPIIDEVSRNLNSSLIIMITASYLMGSIFVGMLFVMTWHITIMGMIVLLLASIIPSAILKKTFGVVVILVSIWLWQYKMEMHLFITLILNQAYYFIYFLCF